MIWLHLFKAQAFQSLDSSGLISHSAQDARDILLRHLGTHPPIPRRVLQLTLPLVSPLPRAKALDDMWRDLCRALEDFLLYEIRAGSPRRLRCVTLTVVLLGLVDAWRLGGCLCELS